MLHLTECVVFRACLVLVVSQLRWRSQKKEVVSTYSSKNFPPNFSLTVCVKCCHDFIIQFPARSCRPSDVLEPRHRKCYRPVRHLLFQTSFIAALRKRDVSAESAAVRRRIFICESFRLVAPVVWLFVLVVGRFLLRLLAICLWSDFRLWREWLFTLTMQPLGADRCLRTRSKIPTRYVSYTPYFLNSPTLPHLPRDPPISSQPSSSSACASFRHGNSQLPWRSWSLRRQSGRRCSQVRPTSLAQMQTGSDATIITMTHALVQCRRSSTRLRRQLMTTS